MFPAGRLRSPQQGRAGRPSALSMIFAAEERFQFIDNDVFWLRLKDDDATGVDSRGATPDSLLDFSACRTQMPGHGARTSEGPTAPHDCKTPGPDIAMGAQASCRAT